MQNAQLIISTLPGTTSTVGKCSMCEETFALNGAAGADPIMAQSRLRDAFDAHVQSKHAWRADANETAALRLREMMKDWED